MLLTLIGKYDCNIIVCLSLYPIFLLPKIIRKLFKVNISYSVEFMYIIFILVAQLLGRVANFYEFIPWYDSFVHFISGILIGVFSLQLLIIFNKYNSKDKLFNILFSIAFTLMLASLWEIFEFFTDTIFSKDTQRVIETGVKDTIKDMVCTLLGCSLFLVVYIYDTLINGDKLKNLFIV